MNVSDLSPAQERALVTAVKERRGYVPTNVQERVLACLERAGLISAGFAPSVTLAGYQEAARRGVISAPLIRFYLDTSRRYLVKAAPDEALDVNSFKAWAYAQWLLLTIERQRPPKRYLKATVRRLVDEPNRHEVETLRLLVNGSMYYNAVQFEALDRRGWATHDPLVPEGVVTPLGWSEASRLKLIEPVRYKSGQLAHAGDRVRVAGNLWRHVTAIKTGFVRGEYYSLDTGKSAVWYSAGQCTLIERGNPARFAFDKHGRILMRGDICTLTTDSARRTVTVAATWHEYVHIFAYGLKQIVLADDLSFIRHDIKALDEREGMRPYDF